MNFKPFSKYDNSEENSNDTHHLKPFKESPLFNNSKSPIVPKGFSEPFEDIFSTNIEFSSPSSLKEGSLVEQTTNQSVEAKHMGILKALGVFLSIVIFSSIALIIIDQNHLISEKRFAYLEFKIMSPNGDVSPGASVYINGEKMGISDSFGEWRRFVRVGLGNKLNIEISKNNSNPPLKGKKIMNIPNKLNSHEELEIKSTIKLVKKILPDAKSKPVKW